MTNAVATNQTILVVGGGIEGMTAAPEAADQPAAAAGDLEMQPETAELEAGAVTEPSSSSVMGSCGQMYMQAVLSCPLQPSRVCSASLGISSKMWWASKVPSR